MNGADSLAVYFSFFRSISAIKGIRDQLNNAGKATCVGIKYQPMKGIFLEKNLTAFQTCPADYWGVLRTNDVKKINETSGNKDRTEQ